MNFAEIAMKFLLGLLAMVTIINMTGKGNLAPTSAMEQIMNYVLGGIIGGVIYSRDVRIWQFRDRAAHLVRAGLWHASPQVAEPSPATFA